MGIDKKYFLLPEAVNYYIFSDSRYRSKAHFFRRIVKIEIILCRSSLFFLEKHVEK